MTLDDLLFFSRSPAFSSLLSAFDLRLKIPPLGSYAYKTLSLVCNFFPYSLLPAWDLLIVSASVTGHGVPAHNLFFCVLTFHLG